MTGAPPQERLSLKWSAHVSEVEVDKISSIFIAPKASAEGACILSKMGCH